MSGAPDDCTPDASSSISGTANSSAVIDGSRRAQTPAARARSVAAIPRTLATLAQMRSVKRFAICRV